MINIAKQDRALGGTYPPEDDPANENLKKLRELSENNDELSGKVEELEKTLKEAQDENEQLKKKLRTSEDFIKLVHVDKIVGQKLAIKVLKEEGLEEEKERLNKLDIPVLKALSDELASFSDMKVRLSEDKPPTTDEPTPIAPPTAEPVQLTDEQKLEQEEQEMRLKLFGHKESADEYYMKKAQETYDARTRW